MDYGIDIVFLETAGDILGGSDTALKEGEVWALIERFCVSHGSPIVQLVEGNEVVVAFIGESKSSDNPRTSVANLLALGSILAQGPE